MESLNSNETDRLLNTSTGYGSVDIVPNDHVEIIFEESSIRDKIIYFIDCTLSAFLFAPILNALYWYGTWSLMDAYILPDNIVLSSFVCYVAGLIILMPGYVFQELLQNFYDRITNRNIKFLIRCIHVYVISLGYVLEWRGCWTLCDKYVLVSWKGSLSLAIIAITFLLMTRSFRFVAAPPFILDADQINEYYFLSTTRYRFRSLRSTYIQYAIDFFIAELIESFASILAWRDLQLLLDQYLYPNTFLIHTILTLSIGYFIYYIVVLTQYQTYKFASQYTLIPRLIIEDMYNSLMFLSVILLGDAYWNVPAKYLVSDKYSLIIFLSLHFGCYLLAIIFHASVVVTGFGYDFKDGSINENGNYFKISYLSTFVFRN